MTVRSRLLDALAGKPVTHPVYAVYDWFVEHRDIDWQCLFDQGLGQVNHANLIEYNYPHRHIVESESTLEDGRKRRDVRWITDQGQLHEWYLDEWRMEYFIKSPDDYQLMAYALSDVKITPTNKYFEESEAKLGDRGVTIGQFGCIPAQSRTAFQRIQVDFAGLERFSYDIAAQLPQLLDLLELMNEQKLQEVRAALATTATQIKLWENLSIETMGPHLYRKHLVPLYLKILALLEGSDKKICVHYDGKLRIIADDIHHLPFDGLDSLTPPPEGDLGIAEARTLWPDKFFWLHPSLGWFSLAHDQLAQRIEQMARQAGPSRYCLMLSEEIPPDWSQTIPTVLRTLEHVQLTT